MFNRNQKHKKQTGECFREANPRTKAEKLFKKAEAKEKTYSFEEGMEVIFFDRENLVKGKIYSKEPQSETYRVIDAQGFLHTVSFDPPHFSEISGKYHLQVVCSTENKKANGYSSKLHAVESGIVNVGFLFCLGVLIG